MTAYFVDSSALVKRYVPETGSAWIRALSAQQTGNSLFIARITWVEVLSAIARREREGSLTPTDRILIIQRFRSDLNNQYQVIELDSTLAVSAGQLVTNSFLCVFVLVYDSNQACQNLAACSSNRLA